MFDARELAALLATLPLVFGAAAARNATHRDWPSWMSLEGRRGSASGGAVPATASESGHGSAGQEGGGGQVWGAYDWAAVQRLTRNVCARLRSSLLAFDHSALRRGDRDNLEAGGSSTRAANCSAAAEAAKSSTAPIQSHAALEALKALAVLQVTSPFPFLPPSLPSFLPSPPSPPPPPPTK